MFILQSIWVRHDDSDAGFYVDINEPWNFCQNKEEARVFVSEEEIKGFISNNKLERANFRTIGETDDYL